MKITKLMNKKIILLILILTSIIGSFAVFNSRKKAQKLLAITKADNLIDAKKCQKDLKYCNKRIDVNLLPIDLQELIAEKIAENEMRTEQKKLASSCLNSTGILEIKEFGVTGLSKACKKINFNYLSKFDSSLSNELNDFISNKKIEVAKEVEEKEKENAAQLAKAKKDREEFEKLKWWEIRKGILARYCTSGPKPCSSGAVIGDQSYVLVEIWCKERACGDIYAKVNLLDSEGTVVGWTNDTSYGGYGQKVLLTFSSYQENWSKARLVEFTTY